MIKSKPTYCDHRVYPEDPCNGWIQNDAGATGSCPNHETERCPQVDIAAVNERYLADCGFGRRYRRPDETRLFGSSPKATAVAEGVRRYWSEIADAVAGGRGMLLMGNVGVGKTFALAATALRARGLGTIRFVFCPTLMNLLHERSSDVDQYQRCDLLLLDDFGVEYSADWSLSRFQAFVEYRHSNELATCVTTNLGVEAMRGLGGHERIVSRWVESCSEHTYVINAEDLRRSE